jgi:hypothetical protein
LWASAVGFPTDWSKIVADIIFTTRLTDADWDDTLRGWRCSPLAVPGAAVDELFIDGNRIDAAKYEVLPQYGVVRWTPPDHPSRAVASIKLTEKLTLSAETDRWKKLAIILPVLATILSAGITGAVTLMTKSDSKPTPLPASRSEAIVKQSQTTPVSPASRTKYSFALPELREYVVGRATYTLMKAELAPRTSELDTIRIRIRAFSHAGSSGLNFWSDSFRLIVDGLPQPPINYLNEVVEAEAAKEGEVEFAVQHGIMRADLAIRSGGESTKVALNFEPLKAQ